MLNAVNGRVLLDGGVMDYIRFGSGERTMVMIPGVGDGLKTVRGMAVPFALLYRQLAKDFTVYVFSRRRELPPLSTTREMAADLAAATDRLGLPPACVLGVSQGGMIAQYLAIDHPEKVGRLILAVTLAGPNDTVRDVIGRWLGMAERGDYRGIMIDTAERSYSEKKLRRERAMYALLGSVGKPKSFDRFVTQAKACLSHDARDELAAIRCPTLVIGGSEDRIVTAEGSRELAAKIPGAQLLLYEGLSHGAYEEAPDFTERVRGFFLG